MLIAVWIAAFVGIACWSLIAWGLHTLLLSDPTRVQDLKPLIDKIPYGESIEQWLPGWQTLVQFVIDLTQGLLSGLANAAPWLAWALWAVGMLVILLVAGALSLLVIVARNGIADSRRNRALQHRSQ